MGVGPCGWDGAAGVAVGVVVAVGDGEVGGVDGDGFGALGVTGFVGDGAAAGVDDGDTVGGGGEVAVSAELAVAGIEVDLFAEGQIEGGLVPNAV